MQNFYILDVKHGNCSILFDNDVIIIVDTGPGSSVIDFLEGKNVSTISTIIISHADKDHIGGLIALLSSDLKIKEIFINSDSTKKGPVWDDLCYTLYNKDKNQEIEFHTTITSGTNIPSDKVKVEILAPNKYLVGKGVGNNDRNGKQITSNTLSSVVRLSFKSNCTILLPGDIDEIGLNNLLRDFPNILADVIVFPHHGGKVGSGNPKYFTKIFCSATKCNHIIFSIKKNDNQYPIKEILDEIITCLPNVILYTTNYSDTVGILKKLYKHHKNDTGTISLDLASIPLKFLFER